MSPCTIEGDDRLSDDVFEEEREEEEKGKEEGITELIPSSGSASSMLQEGQAHEVWLPGRRSTTRRSFCSKGDIEMRRRSLLQRVSSLSLPDQTTLRKKGKNRMRSSKTEMLELRMKQWNKIEEKEGSGSDDDNLSQTSQVITTATAPPNDDISTHQISSTKSSLPQQPLEDYIILEESDTVIANGGDDVKKDEKVVLSKVSQTYFAKRKKFVTSLDNEIRVYGGDSTAIAHHVIIEEEEEEEGDEFETEV